MCRLFHRLPDIAVPVFDSLLRRWWLRNRSTLAGEVLVRPKRTLGLFRRVCKVYSLHFVFGPVCVWEDLRGQVRGECNTGE